MTEIQRACFTLRVRPDRLAGYRRSHERVWPEFLAALRDTGWRNYSVFLGPDGLVVGYFESADPQESLRRMAQTSVNARWQAAMAEFFEQPGGDGTSPALLTEVFNLDEQMCRGGQGATGPAEDR